MVETVSKRPVVFAEASLDGLTSDLFEVIAEVGQSTAEDRGHFSYDRNITTHWVAPKALEKPVETYR